MRKAYILFEIDETEISIEVEPHWQKKFNHDCVFRTTMIPVGSVFNDGWIPTSERFYYHSHKLEEVKTWTMDILDYYKVYYIESPHII